MHTTRTSPARSLGLGFALLALAGLLAAPVSAEEHRGERHEEHRGERHDGHRGERRDGHDRYENHNWVYDGRYHHDHYYPARGYAVRVLPPDYLSLNYRGGRFFFQAGVWFAPGPGGYVVVQPPLGVPVPALPPGYATVWSHGRPYYYANDVYYVQGPGGYEVAQAPLDAGPPPAPQSGPSMGEMPPPPGNVAPAAPAQAGGSVWYYCDSAKGYYPYVPSCAEGWRTVPASPPPPR